MKKTDIDKVVARQPNSVFMATVRINKIPQVVFIKNYTGKN